MRSARLLHRASRMLPAVLVSCAMFSGQYSFAECPIDHVMVSGRVEDAPANAVIRVQLVYASKKAGDAAELTLDRSAFRIDIPFLTQSRGPVLGGGMGELGQKCRRKPESVIVTLVESEHEDDRLSLEFEKDFVKTDPSSYAPRSEIVLRGPQKEPPPH